MHTLPLAVAFLFGLAAKFAHLPPLIGFLAAGFLLGAMGMQNTPVLQHIADLGVTLLLFTIGLKLHVRDLISPVVWATASIHMLLTTLLVAVLVSGLALLGIGLLADIDAGTALLIGFAMSFSSTVFAVKVLEERADTGSLYGRTAIGILIVALMASFGVMIVDALLPGLAMRERISLIRLPPIMMSPLVGLSSPDTMRRIVVLPQPVSPTRPTFCPPCTTKFTPSNTLRVPP